MNLKRKTLNRDSLTIKLISNNSAELNRNCWVVNRLLRSKFKSHVNLVWKEFKKKNSIKRAVLRSVFANKNSQEHFAVTNFSRSLTIVPFFSINFLEVQSWLFNFIYNECVNSVEVAKVMLTGYVSPTRSFYTGSWEQYLLDKKLVRAEVELLSETDDETDDEQLIFAANSDVLLEQLESNSILGDTDTNSSLPTSDEEEEEDIFVAKRDKKVNIDLELSKFLSTYHSSTVKVLTYFSNTGVGSDVDDDIITDLDTFFDSDLVLDKQWEDLCSFYTCELLEFPFFYYDYMSIFEAINDVTAAYSDNEFYDMLHGVIDGV